MKRVVLVRPEGPRNAGMALRAVANFGPAELWIVAPARPSLLVHPDFEQMSHGVSDVLERVVVVDDLADALADCTWSVGFTARVRGHRQMRHWRELAPELVPRCSAPDERVALVFGNEVTGLTRAESDLMQEIARISTSEEHTSLNLAMAATVVLYSLFDGPPSRVETHRGEPLLGTKREYLKRHAVDALGQIARSEAIRKDIEESAARVFARAPLETRDARAWHAIFRALGNRKSPLDYGLKGPSGE